MTSGQSLTLQQSAIKKQLPRSDLLLMKPHQIKTMNSRKEPRFKFRLFQIHFLFANVR